MSHLPDNYSHRAFEARYQPVLPLGHDAERLGELESDADQIRRLVASLLVSGNFPDLVEQCHDALGDVPAMAQRIRDDARCDGWL